MPLLIDEPTRIDAAGAPPKTIEEFVGRVNTSTHSVVLRGVLVVEHEAGRLEVTAGQAVRVEPGE